MSVGPNGMVITGVTDNAKQLAVTVRSANNGAWYYASFVNGKYFRTTGSTVAANTSFTDLYDKSAFYTELIDIKMPFPIYLAAFDAGGICRAVSEPVLVNLSFSGGVVTAIDSKIRLANTFIDGPTNHQLYLVNSDGFASDCIFNTRESSISTSDGHRGFLYYVYSDENSTFKETSTRYRKTGDG